MIRKGDTVRIRKEWQDKGDDAFHWIAVSDEDRGKVDISPTNTGFRFAPRQTVDVYMLEASE